MNLSFLRIRDKGDLANERLVFRASANTDIGEYVLIKAFYTDDTPYSGEPEFSFWFMDKPIKKNDLVVIYSKVGSHSSKLLENERTSHFFYLDQEHTLWDEDNYRPVLLEVARWKVCEV